MMEQMTIDELHKGMHVTLRDGSKCVISTIKVNRYVVDIEDGSWESFDSYHANMTNKDFSSLDIIEVFDNNGVQIFAEETMTKAEAEAKFGIRIVD